jgi:hypothetical protein
MTGVRPAVGFVWLALLCLSARGAQARVAWSAPLPVAPDSAAFVRQGWHSTEARDTVLWTLWSEDRGAGQCPIRASRFSGGSWLEPELVAGDTAWGEHVETAVDADLNPWAVWSNTRYITRDSSYSFQLWSRRQGGAWTSPERVTDDTTGLGGSPSLSADPVQGAWAIWTMVREDSVSFLSSRFLADSWAPQVLVARFYWWWLPYVSVITAPPGGQVRSVWTGALSGGLGIYSSTWTGEAWGDPELIPGSWAGYYHSACSDSAGGTWVTWLAGTSMFCARHDGVAWSDTWCLATGFVHCFRGMLCCDDRGRVWAIWTDSTGISARYFDGAGWSDRSVVASGPGIYGDPRIAAALGRVWVTWARHESDNRFLLYYSHTLPAGIAGDDAPPVGRVGNLPTLIRGLLVLPPAPGGGPETAGVLLDVTGRRVMALGPGENDVRHLAPGVYFFRRQDTGESCRLVLVE